MVHGARASHIGSNLSMADILAVLYGRILRVRADEPAWAGRDRFVLSKGHATASLYAALALRGFFAREQLSGFCSNGSLLTGHVSHQVPGVEFSTGSLGHGLSLGAGLALGSRIDDAGTRTYVLLSDGECDEGPIWEAAMFASHHLLDNLVAIVDWNGIQSLGHVSEVLELQPFADKWRSFRWHVIEIDGHDHTALIKALSAAPGQGLPTAVLCHTIKGKGVSFMENQLAWHYKSPNDIELSAALCELGFAP
jgi:transketolase